jgi:hypothetical protein
MVANTREFLDSIEDNFALFQGALIQQVSLVNSLALDEASDLINLAVQPTSADEVGELTFYYKSYVSKKPTLMPNCSAMHSKVTVL